MLAGSVLTAGCSSGAPGASVTEGAQEAEVTVAAAKAPSQPAPVPTMTQGRAEWRKTISKMPAPKDGCFRVSYPSTTLEEIPCGAAPSAPHPLTASLLAHLTGAAEPSRSAGSRLAPDFINGGSDDNASVSGSLALAEGSFPFESGGASETSSPAPVSAPSNPGANSYSLQLNTNAVNAATACNSGTTFQNGCQGWEQFVYDPQKQQAYIEFSLINYSGSCPAPFGSSYIIKGTTTQVCWFNSDHVSPPAVAPSNLTGVTMTATTGVNALGAPTDTLTLDVNGTSYVNFQPSILGLASGWNDAEFNIVGENSGAGATFNSPTTLEVQVATESAVGTTAPPSCPNRVAGAGATAESNSLNLVGACCPYGGPSPGIRYTESNVTGAATGFVCPPAPSCTYAFACTGGGQVSIACTPDGNSPSDPISIYQVVNGQTQQPAIDTRTFTTTDSTPTSITTVSTLSSSLASQTFLGCTGSSWGGLNCDSTPTTVSTPSCVGVTCGTNSVYDTSGQCVAIGSGCGSAPGYVIGANGQCLGVSASCGTNSVVDNVGECVVIGSSCAYEGDVAGTWGADGECNPVSITCPAGEVPAGPFGNQYCVSESSGSSSGSTRGSGSGGGTTGSGGGSSGAGCLKCVKPM